MVTPPKGTIILYTALQGHLELLQWKFPLARWLWRTTQEKCVGSSCRFRVTYARWLLAVKCHHLCLNLFEFPYIFHLKWRASTDVLTVVKVDSDNRLKQLLNLTWNTFGLLGQQEKELPRLIRGQLHRCVGNYDRRRDVLMCVSIRPSLPSELRNAQEAVKVCDAEMRMLVKSLNEVWLQVPLRHMTWFSAVQE